MNYKEISPGDRLKDYVKCYYISETSMNESLEDRAFATGCVEIMFNLGTGSWQTAVNGEYVTTPGIELWGQIIQPLSFRSLGENIMFGIRFFPHTASLFLNEDIRQFNNQVFDFKDVGGTTVRLLHSKLLENPSLGKRVEIVEDFLLRRLSLFEKKISKIQLISNIMNELKQDDFFDNIENVASRYGITSRYLQKIFLQYSGLTPKLFSKINRFQNSLQLVAKKGSSLTSIAYDSGYFDQSHFIREFKSFTGFTPSAYIPANSSAILISANK